MSSSNHVHLIGNMCEDPELRYTPNGTPVCDFRMAHNKRYTTSNGQKKEDALFIKVTFWKRQAEVIAEYHRKGDKIAISGELEMEEWETNEGKQTRIVVNGRDFTFFKNKGDSNSPPSNPQQGRRPQQNTQPQQGRQPQQNAQSQQNTQTQQNTNPSQSRSGQSNPRDVQDDEIPF